MQTIFNIFFDYFFLFLGIGFIYYSYRQYTDLKERTAKIHDSFKKTLYPYLEKRYKEAKELANSLKEEYGHVDKLNTEIDRLLLILEKSEDGTHVSLVSKYDIPLITPIRYTTEASLPTKDSEVYTEPVNIEKQKPEK